MTRIFTEDFEGGVDGATLSTANTTFTTIRQAPTFTAASLTGSLAMRATHAVGATDPMGFFAVPAQQTMYLRAYIAREAAVQFFPMRLIQFSPLALRALLVVSATGQVRGLNGSYGGVTTNSTTTIPLGGYARVEWAVTPTTQQVRLFVGENIHGTTPDYQSAAATWTPTGTFDIVQVGNTNADAGADTRIDSVALDDSEWVGPFTEPVEPLESGWFYDTGTEWVPATLHYDTGDTWVDLATADPGP